MKNICLKYQIIAVTICLLLTGLSSFAKSEVITGYVSDTGGEAIIGASVIVNSGLIFVAGAPTDSEGRFEIKLADSISVKGNLEIRVSSIGFETDLFPLKIRNDTTIIDFSLSEKILSVGRIVVVSSEDHQISSVALSADEIEQIAKHSLVPTNPIAAIRQPQVARQGSSHSSRIRVSGTSPTYFLNGIDIGYDPNHYGVFSIVPGSMIKDMRFHPQGTNASFPLSAAIELNSPKPFAKQFRGMFNLSSVEATGSVTIGTGRFFLLASLRKSVLDKLVKQLNIKSDRMTIPPTNFQDIFASVGWKISDSWQLMIDQYYVTDFLSYDASSIADGGGGTNTFQHTRENFIGLRLESLSRNLHFKMNTGYRSVFENYKAHPIDDKNRDFLAIDLEARSRIFQFNAEVALSRNQTVLTIGDNFRKTVDRQISLSQRNWNFLPPDAGSDNPSIYQDEFNRFYGQYTKSDEELNNAGYISLKQTIGNLELETGLRAESFGSLRDKFHVVTRHTLRLRTGPRSHLELYYGTFVENPVNRILESYQVLVFDNLSKLSPIKTRLASITYGHGPVSVSLYHKSTSFLPVVAPDFRCLSSDGTSERCFVSVFSNGRAKFIGGSITLKLKQFLLPRLSLNSYYGYTRAKNIVYDVAFPNDLEAPHQFHFQLDYRVSRAFSVGGETSVRSGNPFTPIRRREVYQENNRLSNNYYIRQLGSTNSSRFPSHVSFNLHADYRFGNSEVYLAVANITNHDNPIINTASGFVSDAGILPTIGFKHLF